MYKKIYSHDISQLRPSGVIEIIMEKNSIALFVTFSFV